MQAMNRSILQTNSGEKSIGILLGDIRELDFPLDVMTVSAYYRSYRPNPHTLFEALLHKGIDVASLSLSPEFDLRKKCNIWLSVPIADPQLPIKRIGCIESSYPSRVLAGHESREDCLISSIRAYFHMLEIMILSGEKIETVGLPIIGGGSQHLPVELLIVPLLNECIRFLHENEGVKAVYIITNNASQAFTAAKSLEASYALIANKKNTDEQTTSKNSSLAFISYSSCDRNAADSLCAKLESNGVRVWYAPRNIHTGDYASAIVNAIDNASHFIVILSKNSLQSGHVLNEIDLAFQKLNHHKLRFYLLKLDEEELGPAFRYYLSRQHWMDAMFPPLEKRLEEFVSKIVEEL